MIIIGSIRSTYPLAKVEEVASASLIGIIALWSASDVDVAPVDSLDTAGVISKRYSKQTEEGDLAVIESIIKDTTTPVIYFAQILLRR